MIVAILLLLIVLWVLGYISLPLTGSTLFVIAGRAITLNDLLVFLVVMWLIGILPTPFREIAFVFFLLWLLGVFGVVAIAGFSQLIVLALIIGIVAYIIRGSASGV